MTIRTLDENEITQVAGGALSTSYATSTSSLQTLLTSSSGFQLKPPRVICAVAGGVGPISCMSAKTVVIHS